jgi:CHASE1-domain containing sensor protein
MAEQWVPVVAAVLGLLGGMAGAAVGGYVANEGQEQRFEHERATQLRDLRTDTYVRFLRAAEREQARPRPTTA